MEATVKLGSHSFKGNAQSVYLEISSIGKEVKPKQIVEYARNNEDSELHKCFTWDDTIIDLLGVTGRFIGIGTQRKNGYGHFSIGKVEVNEGLIL